MYQYIARLRSSLEIIAEGHNIEDVEHKIKSYKRGQKKGEHTNMNVPIEIIHVERDKVKGTGKKTLIKIV